MYQAVNLKQNTYSTKYEHQDTAESVAKLHSSIFRTQCVVVNSDTGEIVSEFDMGLRKEG